MCRGFASEFKATTLIKSTALQRAAGAGGIRFVTMTTHRTVNSWALNSAVECHLHTVEVIGSNPIAPTIWSFPRFYCILSIPISMPFW